MPRRLGAGSGVRGPGRAGRLCEIRRQELIVSWASFQRRRAELDDQRRSRGCVCLNVAPYTNSSDGGCASRPRPRLRHIPQRNHRTTLLKVPAYGGSPQRRLATAERSRATAQDRKRSSPARSRRGPARSGRRIRSMQIPRRSRGEEWMASGWSRGTSVTPGPFAHRLFGSSCLRAFRDAREE